MIDSNTYNLKHFASTSMFQLSLSLATEVYTCTGNCIALILLSSAERNSSKSIWRRECMGKLNVFKHVANGITVFCPCQPCIPFNSNDPLYRQLLNMLHYELIAIMNGSISSQLPPMLPISNVFCLQLTNDAWCVISLAGSVPNISSRNGISDCSFPQSLPTILHILLWIKTISKSAVNYALITREMFSHSEI